MRGVVFRIAYVTLTEEVGHDAVLHKYPALIDVYTLCSLVEVMNKCHAGHVAVSPAILCKLLPCMYIHQEDLIISLLNSNNTRLSEGLATRCCRILKQLDVHSWKT